MKADATHSLVSLFATDARTIADSLGSRETFPQGPAMGMRILSFYMAHVGPRLSRSRQRNLERARQILLARLKREP